MALKCHFVVLKWAVSKINRLISPVSRSVMESERRSLLYGLLNMDFFLTKTTQNRLFPMIDKTAIIVKMTFFGRLKSFKLTLVFDLFWYRFVVLAVSLYTLFPYSIFFPVFGIVISITENLEWAARNTRNSQLNDHQNNQTLSTKILRDIVWLTMFISKSWNCFVEF